MPYPNSSTESVPAHEKGDDEAGFPIRLSGGFLHEVFAGGSDDPPAASGFAVASALLAARGRPIVWIAHDSFESVAGALHPPGLSELGMDPEDVTLVKTRDAANALKASDEAASCEGLGAVVTEIWGEPPRLDLTASRRLSLGAERSGAAVFLLRAAAAPAPSAAFTRWSVRALPSRSLAAKTSGPPSFAVTLLRHRGGAPLREWHVEWDRDAGRFGPRPSLVLSADAPSSRLVVSVPAHRPMEGRARRSV